MPSGVVGVSMMRWPSVRSFAWDRAGAGQRRTAVHAVTRRHDGSGSLCRRQAMLVPLDEVLRMRYTDSKVFPAEIVICRSLESTFRRDFSPLGFRGPRHDHRVGEHHFLSAGTLPKKPRMVKKGSSRALAEIQ